MQTKNTRLIYIDEKNLKAYESLPSDDFKEFFMTYFTYQDGDDVSKTISNPFVQTLFMAAYADKIVYNEEKWEKKAKTNRENGKKGGRKPKNNTDIQPNTEFENQEITEENNMGNYIGYIQNITSQVSEIQDTQIIEVEDNINPQEIKESAPESPNTAINETSDEDFYNVFCEITNNELKTLFNLQKSLCELKKEGKVNTEEYFINREEYYNTIDGYCKDFNKASLKKMRNLIFNTINEKYLIEC